MPEIPNLPNSLIPAIDGEILAKLQRYAVDARGAFSNATVAALKSDTTKFLNWCGQAGLSGLPAAPATVAQFIDEMGERHSTASVRRYVASVATFHKAAGLDNPASAMEVTLALRRLHRAKGRAQRQAAGLSRVHVNKMLRKSPDTLRGLRDRALLTCAYDSLARRSELVGLELSDFAIAEEGGDGSLLIRRAKNDQEGHGQLRYLAKDTVERLTAWVSAAKIESGPVFLAVLKGGRVGGPLGAPEVARIFRRMAQEGGVPPELADKVSGHSTRVGCAVDLVSAGLGIAEVMQAGGWQSATMVARYTAKIEVRRGAVAKLAAKQRR